MSYKDYETDWVLDTARNWRMTNNEITLKRQADRLAKMFRLAVDALEKFDPELKTLTDQDSRKWLANAKKADKVQLAQIEKEKQKKIEEAEQRKAAMAKLTPEELIAFGLMKKAKK